MTTPETVAAMDTLYTSSSGKVTKLGALPYAYLKNIQKKLGPAAPHSENSLNMLEAVNIVIAVKDAEYAAQQTEAK